MSFGYVYGATPAVKSSSLPLEPNAIYSGRRSNGGNPLKFGSAYPLVIFFHFLSFFFFLFRFFMMNCFLTFKRLFFVQFFWGETKVIKKI
jgi:hypothetical protein